MNDKPKPLKIDLDMSRLEGELLTELNGNGAIYWVYDFVGHWVPDPETHDRVFDAESPKDAIGVVSMPKGFELSDGALIARREGVSALYLVTGHTKRHIISPAAKNFYHLLGSLRDLPGEVMDPLPQLENIHRTSHP